MEGQVIVIMRGYSYQQIRCVCQVLSQSKKVRNIEVTLNTKNAYKIIQSLKKEFTNLHIGAGTVTNLEQLQALVELDIEFILSPVGMTKEMIDLCHQHHILAIPGAYTPTEVYNQFCLGADIVKIFPVDSLSEYYGQKILEPLGDLPLMAVGGVNIHNVNDYLNKGFQYVGTLGGIFQKSDIENCDKQALQLSLRQFEAML